MFFITFQLGPPMVMKLCSKMNRMLQSPHPPVTRADGLHWSGLRFGEIIFQSVPFFFALVRFSIVNWTTWLLWILSLQIDGNPVRWSTSLEAARHYRVRVLSEAVLCSVVEILRTLQFDMFLHGLHMMEDSCARIIELDNHIVLGAVITGYPEVADISDW